MSAARARLLTLPVWLLTFTAFLVGITVWSLAAAFTAPQPVSFTDDFGRHCTTYGEAIDCTYPPAESRITSYLNSLTQ